MLDMAKKNGQRASEKGEKTQPFWTGWVHIFHMVVTYSYSSADKRWAGVSWKSAFSLAWEA
jgi:hypothetical protein